MDADFGIYGSAEVVWCDLNGFGLHTSRGIEEQDLKVFMRATVAASDYLTFVPSAVLCSRWYGRHVQLDKYDQVKLHSPSTSFKIWGTERG